MVARAFVPSCPPGMSEPMFASLLFDKAFCMVNLVYLIIVRHTKLMKSLVLRKAEDKTGMLNFKVEALLGMLPSTVSDTLTRVNELSLFSKVATRKWSARPGAT